MYTAGVYWEYIEAILIFAPLACLLLWIAYTRGYFVLPHSRVPAKAQLSLKSVVIVFAIYLGVTIGVASVLTYLVKEIYGMKQIPIPPRVLSWLQLCIFGIILLLFVLYSRTMEKTLIRKIWKDWSIPNAQPISWDIGIGILTWVISFPLVIVVGQLADLLLILISGFESYEQVAVRYLKTTLSSPEQLTIALITILLAAPIIEEFLFRGILQTYFKRYMGTPLAIICSSLCFACFHFAPSQGIGNISLIITLFTFALFLGFIYERQSSLFASIGLHMTFNAMSSFRILFMPDS
jgi:membrane protease YdiL (CAAX protease family)